MIFILAFILFALSTSSASADIVDTMPTNSWLEIPNSRIDAVAYPWKAGEGQQGNVACVIACWAGGALDTNRSVLMVGPGGGHAGYNGTELYGFNLFTLTWSRLSNPVTNPNLIENTNPDGTPNGTFCPSAIDLAPCAEHSYGGIQFDPVADRYMLVPGWRFWPHAGEVPGSPTWAFNPTTATWTRLNTNAPISASFGAASTGRLSAYDSVAGLHWARASWDAPLASFNYSTNTWTTKIAATPTIMNYFHSMAFDPKRRRLIVTGNNCSGNPGCDENLGNNSLVRVYDVSNPAGTITEQLVATTGDQTCQVSNNPGFDYYPPTDSMVCWPGSGNAVYLLDMTTMNWTAQAISNSGSAPVGDVNGTYGRFRYVPNRGVFVLVNATSTNVFVLKLGAVTPDTTPPTNPSNLVATAVSSSQINLTWTASTDNIALSGYRVERSPAGCGSFVEIAQPTTASHNVIGLSPSTTYCFRVRARDGSNNFSGYSANQSAATQAPSGGGGGDFAARCQAAGVVRCWRFDNVADLGTIGCSNCNVAVFQGGQEGHCNTLGEVDRCPTIDANAPGGPAMKFVQPSQSHAAQAGQWYGNYSTDLSVRFGANTTHWAQVRVRFNCGFLFNSCPTPNLGDGGNRVYQILGGNAGGWKIFGLSVGDTKAGSVGACNALDVVVQNNSQRGIWAAYQSCIDYAPFEPNFRFQNAMPPPFCRYEDWAVGKLLSVNGCVEFIHDEWTTVTVRVDLGPAGDMVGDPPGSNNALKNSRFQMWIARDGQPRVQIIDHTEDWWVNLATNEQLGKVWLLPYHTYKDPTEVHPEGNIWYKELIVSTNDPGDPDITPPPIPPLPVVSAPSFRSASCRPTSPQQYRVVCGEDLLKPTETDYWK